MQKYKKQLQDVLNGLSFNVTKKGKEVIEELIGCLWQIDESIRTSEIFESATVGMFEVDVQVKKLDWKMLKKEIDAVPTIEDKINGQSISEDKEEEYEDDEEEEDEYEDDDEEAEE